jgi:methionine synthase I (cobalamin-dependent)
VDDAWGNEGCNELLTLSRPDILRDIHASFFRVGCDVVDTISFGPANTVPADYDLRDRTRELNMAAAFSTAERLRFVAGSDGPTTKLPSLGHISWCRFKGMVKKPLRHRILCFSGQSRADIAAFMARLKLPAKAAPFRNREFFSIRLSLKASA